MDYIDTADAVLFAYDYQRTLRVLTILRRWDPFQGRKALPGGHVDPGEDTRAAAARELAEETSVILPATQLSQVDVYAAPGRDPRGPYRTFAYTALLPTMPRPIAADDAAAAEWTPVPLIRAELHSMAFDHRTIVLDAAATLGLIRAV
ncbi:NUDIX domain-containing protein [Kutzneria sp. 744]|uniref:NUDIX domain-containing protein n=1 Tax=Kutzneria sp. (strain 744) TaxID=345341 RepID=UPI0003EEAB48|nr:NUDIX domain-containing protein [Kutzneria sp. 744]EWM14604.1 DNA hydrolase, MutT/nudix family [Kutzneria sp. 744]